MRRISPWLVFPLALWGLILLILGVISVNPALLFASVGCGGMIFWLTALAALDPDAPVKPKPSLQVPAPFGSGPVDWNSLSALELAMYGQRFPARLYRRCPDVLVTSEKQARQWITGRTVASYPRDELVFASEPGIDLEDDEWWNLFRLPGYSAPDAIKPISSSTEPSSGVPNASTSPPAANRKCNGWAVSGPCDCVKHERAARNNRTFTAREAADIWPDAIVSGWTPWGTARTLREYAKSFPNAIWTPSEHALRRLGNHVGTSSKKLRLPDDAFRADPDDSTHSLFNRLLREAAQIGQILESMERTADCGTEIYADLAAERCRVIAQAKNLLPALIDEDRKREAMVLPEEMEITPLKITMEKLPAGGRLYRSYSSPLPCPGGKELTSFKTGEVKHSTLLNLIPPRQAATTTMSQRAVNAARGREFLGTTKPYSTREARLEIYDKIIKGEL